MTRTMLLAGTMAALALGAAPAVAQMQQKGPEGGGLPQMQGAPSGQPSQGSPQGAQKAEPKGPAEKGTAQGRSEPGKGAAETEPKGKSGQGTAEKVEPKSKTEKGTAQGKSEPGKGTAQSEPKGKAGQGTAEKAEPKSKAEKGTAQGKSEPGKGAAQTEPKGTEPGKAAKAPDKGSAGRVQLSEQQRTNVGQTVLKERSVNRVTNVNVSINVGTRVPRSVRLAVLPASVIAIVPAYRSYRYFVVDERVCIVDPATYEIVEIVTVSDRTATRGRASSSHLVLTEEERSIILSEIDLRGGSTLGLGVLTEGAEIPRNVELRTFPATIVEKVPKVKEYRFFTAENRVAIVDPQGARVQLVIGERR
jgi:uncharacterized protein DUF1236